MTEGQKCDGCGRDAPDPTTGWLFTTIVRDRDGAQGDVALCPACIEDDALTAFLDANDARVADAEPAAHVHTRPPTDEELEWLRGKPITQERFEDLLLRIRNAASGKLTELSVEGIKEGAQHQEVIEDQRAVWHAAEVALAVLLMPRYIPKRETLADMRALLEMYGGGEDG